MATKKKEVVQINLSKEEIEDRYDSIVKLSKRLPKVFQDLEIEGLDMLMYSKAMAEGKFPAIHLMIVGSQLTKAHTELGRIIKAWNEIFVRELGDQNEPSA